MIQAELADDHQIHVGCKRVAHPMRAAGLQGVMPSTGSVGDAYDKAHASYCLLC